MNARIRPVASLHRGIHDPDLWLEGTLGDGFQPDQKHIFKFHESLTDLPSFVGGPVDRV